METGAKIRSCNSYFTRLVNKHPQHLWWFAESLAHPDKGSSRVLFYLVDVSAGWLVLWQPIAIQRELAELPTSAPSICGVLQAFLKQCLALFLEIWTGMGEFFAS
jgi:hypothetical protein